MSSSKSTSAGYCYYSKDKCIQVNSQSPRVSEFDGEKYWPIASGRYGKSPHIGWSNLPRGCDFVTIKIVDLGGVGEYAKEGSGFVHLHLERVPASLGKIDAGQADKLAQVYGKPNSLGQKGYVPFNPPHPPHFYAIQVQACGSSNEVMYPFPPPPPPPSFSSNKKLKLYEEIKKN